MPRVRDLVDYSQSRDDGGGYKPRETLIEVPTKDSVSTITIHFQPSSFVQVNKDKDSGEWIVTTNLNVNKTTETQKFLK